MSIVIAKEYRWEMGHRLMDHEGLCKNVHGHSYCLRVDLEGSLNNSGMVMDFFDLDKLVHPLVDQLDHCFLCDESDSAMVEFFLSNPMKVVMVDFPTTVENICMWIAEELKPALAAHAALTAFSIRLYETERSFAQCRVVLEH